MTDDETYLEMIWRIRYAADGDHALCPKCEQVRTFKRYAMNPPRKSWTCTACGYHLHPLAGTIFHKSGTPLSKWFAALGLVMEGGSALMLQRELGLNYKTALRMHRGDFQQRGDGRLDVSRRVTVTVSARGVVNTDASQSWWGWQQGDASYSASSDTEK